MAVPVKQLLHRVHDPRPCQHNWSNIGSFLWNFASKGGDLIPASDRDASCKGPLDLCDPKQYVRAVNVFVK